MILATGTLCSTNRSGYCTRIKFKLFKMMARPEMPSTIQERIPSSSRRYDDTQAGHTKKRTIPVGTPSLLAGDDEASRPYGPVPDDWIECVHVVEGIPFFYNSKLKIITDAYIRMAPVLAQVEHWHALIAEAIRSLDSNENQLSTMDIYIDPFQDPQTGQKTCTYYLVDHSKCTIAFLRKVDTGSVGLPDVRSNIHLERVLRCEYWTHCEYMPRPDVDHSVYAKRLQGQLTALMIDSISSEGSTSPFTPEECKSYLRGVEQTNQPQFLNWSVARVNSLLIQSQIINLHGEQWARPDRTTVVTGQHASIRSANYLQTSRIMFDWPAAHLDRLENAWVDRVIYSHHWKKLLSQLLEEWMAAAGVAGLIWLANMVLFSNASSPVVQFLLGISTVSTVFGASKALLLIRSHRAMGQYAAHGSQFLQSNEKYGTGLQGLSFEYSYPWACALWGGGLTSIAVLWVMFSELVGFMYGLVFCIGSIQPSVVWTGVLMAGAWAYGRGVDPRTLLSSPPPRPQYVIRTR